MMRRAVCLSFCLMAAAVCVRAQCPKITIKANAQMGDMITVFVEVTGVGSDETPTYNWTVSAGTISSGQGTSAITVDTTGNAGKRMTATVDLGGFEAQCDTRRTTTVVIRSASMDVSDSRQDQCSSEAKAALYESFIKHRQADQSKAYDDAKKYLACPAGEVTEAQQKIADYLKKYVSAYEAGMSKVRLIRLIYNEQKYAEAYQLAKEVLAKEPDNLKLLVHLGVNGYLLGPLNNQALNAQALDYARRALQQLESGQTLEDWEPLTGRELAIAYLNYTVGTLTIEKEPATAVTYLIKAAQVETPLKKSPYTYAYIAGAYETGDYAKQSEDYKRDFAGKDETPESKLALANIYEITDRMIDGYARAVALAGNDPKFASVKAGWNESLGKWYQFRNGSDVGMSELVANILTKPLPPLPARRTSL